jgi:hypothetical protein
MVRNCAPENLAPQSLDSGFAATAAPRNDGMKRQSQNAKALAQPKKGELRVCAAHSKPNLNSGALWFTPFGRQSPV